MTLSIFSLLSSFLVITISTYTLIGHIHLLEKYTLQLKRQNRAFQCSSLEAGRMNLEATYQVLEAIPLTQIAINLNKSHQRLSHTWNALDCAGIEQELNIRITSKISKTSTKSPQLPHWKPKIDMEP